MICSPIPQENWALVVGTVLRVSHGWYYHVGLMGDRILHGEPSVLAFSADAKGYVEQPYSAFAFGRLVTIDGYLGSLPPAIVMQRARLKQGQAYSWTDFNCEHFVRYAHGVPIESPQLREWTLIAGIVGLLTYTAARA